MLSNLIWREKELDGTEKEYIWDLNFICNVLFFKNYKAQNLKR